jgi:hypothetical protein
LGAPFALLGEADFHKMKGRKTLSRSHSNLNTSDSNAGLTESFSTSTELQNEYGILKIWVLKFLLIF